MNQDLDLIISQKEATMYGVPIQVYFFSRNKVWKEYERIQSDIFDHLLAMVPKFDLKVYQYSDWMIIFSKYSHHDEKKISSWWEFFLITRRIFSRYGENNPLSEVCWDEVYGLN